MQNNEVNNADNRWFRSLVRKAGNLKNEVYVLYLACKHPTTPWYAKLFALIVAGYAFSPIDLIPDFIPILGYIDDLLLIPAGVWLTLRLIPQGVIDECRVQASAHPPSKPRSWVAAAMILLVWSFAVLLVTGACL